MDAEQAVTTIMIRAEIVANQMYRERLQQGTFFDDPFKRSREPEKFSFDIDEMKVDPSMKDQLGDIAKKAVKEACKIHKTEFGSLLLGYPVRYQKIYDAFD